jgi:hypothetical protein
MSEKRMRVSASSIHYPVRLCHSFHAQAPVVLEHSKKRSIKTSTATKERLNSIMKNRFKYALLAASALAVAASAQAAYSSGDLLIGFTGGSSDFIYDLGKVTSLTSGETWSLGSALGTQFGVVGASAPASGFIYATSADSAENGYVLSANYSQAKANIATIAGTLTLAGQSRTTTPGDTTGWTYQTSQPAGTPGNILQNNLFDPNVSVGSTAYLFQNAAQTAALADGSFTYDTSSGMVTYTAVPEPATFSLLGGLGLLALALRRHLVKA